MKLVLLLLLALSLRAAGDCTGSAELVANGSFEFLGQNWTLVDLDGATTFENFLAFRGNFSVEAGPEVHPGRLTQVLPTVKNTLYAFSYHLTNDGNVNVPGQNFFRALLDGQEVDGSRVVNFPPGQYLSFLFFFTATRANTNLTFQYLNPRGYYYLDEVSVQAVACRDRYRPVDYDLLPSLLLPGNLVGNSGFELLLTSWTVTTNSTTDPLVRVVGLHPHSGRSCVQLGPGVFPSSLSQNVSLTAGALYRLGYYLSNDGDGDNDAKFFQVLLDGVVIPNSLTANLPPQVWAYYEFVLLAPAARATLSFQALNADGYFFLDDVSLLPAV